MRLQDAVDGYLLSLQASHASPKTIQLYGMLLNRLVQFALKQRRDRLSHLTVQIAKAWLVSLQGDPYEHGGRPPNWKGGDNMAFLGVCALRGLGRCMRAEGHAVPDFGVIRLPKRPERIQPRVTPEEFRALEAAVLKRLLGGRSSRLVVARDLAILSLLADTGLRASEFCGLRMEDVDLEAATITVRQGKGNKARVLNIRDDDPSEREGGPTMRAVADYLSYRAQAFGVRSRQRAFWITAKGGPLKPAELRRLLSQWCEQAGIEGSRPPHAFRRAAFSTAYRQRPTALPELAARMGWSPKSDMVEVYTRGAEIDFAREMPQPSIAKQWRNQISTRITGPGLSRGGAGPGGAKANRPSPSTRGKKSGEWTASADLRRDLRR